jgi:hypothetical protein
MRLPEAKPIFLYLLFCILVGCFLAPLYLLVSEDVLGGFKRVANRELNLRHRSSSHTQFPSPGWKLSEDPRLNRDGSRLLLHATHLEKGDGLFLWTEGAGTVPLPRLEGNSISSVAMNDAGSLIAVIRDLKTGDEQKSLWIWEEGLGSKELPGIRLYGQWKLDVSGDGTRLALMPTGRDSYAVDDAKSDDILRAGLLFLLMADGSWNIQQLKAIPDVTTLTLGADDIVQVSKSGGDPTRFRQLRAYIPKDPSRFDSNGDDADDLLSFESARPRAPIWRSFALNGFRRPMANVSAEEAITASWQQGFASGIPVEGDYNGDGIADLATYLPGFYPGQLGARSNWKIAVSRIGAQGEEPERTLEAAWGFGDMKPVPADYDGDGAFDIAVFANASARWHLLFSRGDFDRAKADIAGNSLYGESIQWGLAGDCLLPDDYNGDGCADLAVVRPEKAGAESSLHWWIRFMPCRGQSLTRDERFSHGQSGDIPVPADYDGNGSVDIGVYRPSEGVWYFRTETGEVKREKWSIAEGEPLVGDYDGDGLTDLAFYHAAGPDHWFIRYSAFPRNVHSMFPYSSPSVAKLSWGSDRALPTQLIRRRNRNCNGVGATATSESGVKKP